MSVNFKSFPASIDEAIETGFTCNPTVLQSEFFGPVNEQNRFKLVKMLTRFGIVVHFVYDAAQLDEYDLPATIAQEENRNLAILKAMMLTGFYDTVDIYAN